MARNPIETIMGAVVLLIAALFLAFAYSTTADLADRDGYRLQARFAKVGGLQTGSEVRISGIKVGTVTHQSLDPQTYQAVVEMTILPTVSLPEDTVGSIASDGLLGTSYLELEPGTSHKILSANDSLRKVRDYKSLEDLISQIIFLAAQNGPSPHSGQGFP